VIPFVDLKAQYRSLKTDVDAAIARVLETTAFALGPEVAAFETEFAAFCEAEHAIGVNTGTSALHLALIACGVGAGDEVITVAHTFAATAAAIHYTGAEPVYVDIDPRSFTMDPSKIEAAITPKTKAIIPVHLYGHAADMDPILAIAKKHKLAVIEDACQAHGARYKGKRVGGLGNASAFSFYPGKNLGAYGEGGAVVTNDPDIAKTIRLYRDWGQPQKYHHVVRGYNYRLEGIQGAVLRVKLRHLEAWNNARAANAATYHELLAGTHLQLPETMAWSSHVFHVFAVRTPRREPLQAFLAKENIQSGIHYPIPVHLQPAYASAKSPAGSLPVTEAAAREVLSLPMFPELTREQIATVADAIKRFDATT
jgi:dTDP-4-amino-4,6-dideoxygalactose transaminase